MPETESKDSMQLPAALLGGVVGGAIGYLIAMNTSPSAGALLAVLVGASIGLFVGWNSGTPSVEKHQIKCPECGRYSNITGVKKKNRFYLWNLVELVGNCDKCDRKITRTV